MVQGYLFKSAEESEYFLPLGISFISGKIRDLKTCPSLDEQYIARTRIIV